MWPVHWMNWRCLVLASIGLVVVVVGSAVGDVKNDHQKRPIENRWRENHHHHKHPHHNGGHHLKHNGDNGPVLEPGKHEVQMKKISWLNVPEVTGCHCKHSGEICIEGPDKQPMCVKEHHIKESAHLFKHYHENKEKAEEYLNEVDPNPKVLNNLHLQQPHNPHIKLTSRHNAVPNSAHQPQESSHGLTPKAGKHERERALLHVHQVQSSKNAEMDKSALKTACDASMLDEMRSRLTGWFHLLHGKEHHHSHGDVHHLTNRKLQRHLSVKKELHDGKGEDCECLKSVMWEFRQIDIDRDHTLNRTEVKAIDNNDMEPCLHPYLAGCDTDDNGLLSRKEWCCCFPQKEAESPCYAKLIEIETTKNTEEYIPNCDHEGYYKKEQCVEDLNSQSCWCVTPTGSEIPGSRTVGRALCGKIDNMGYPKNMS